MVQHVTKVSALLIVSGDPERLVKFYRDLLGMPLEEEQHGEMDAHWGCTFGDVHFAIHPPSNFAQAPATGPGGFKIAMRCPDVDAAIDAARAAGAPVAMEPEDLGWCRMAALRDPDGNYVELVEKTD